MEKEIIEQLKLKLQKEKESLENELKSFAEKDPNIKYNWKARYPNREDGTDEEEADETQEYENLVSLEQNLELKLKDVSQALEKMEGGNYGKCEKCGKEVEQERLMACPEAKTCIKCNK